MPTLSHISHVASPAWRVHTKSQVDAVAQAIADHLPAMQHIAMHDGQDTEWLHLAADTATDQPECMLHAHEPMPNDTIMAVDVHPYVGEHNDIAARDPHYTVYLLL